MAKKKILLVEDDQDLSYAVQMRLESAGFEVVIAEDGQAALDKARQDIPDAMILDLMLPKIHGYMVCRMLKFDPKYKNIPVIIFTACGQEKDQKLGYEVGADAYIIKPFDPQVLLETVRRFTGGDPEAPKS